MQLILDRNCLLRRFQFRWIGPAVLALAFWTLPQAAPGQAQIGTAESCFDQGPDRLPARAAVPIPPAPAALPSRIGHAGKPARIQPQKTPTSAPVRSMRENARNQRGPTSGTKNPGDAMAAVR
jgi:hypothetical protein